MPPRRPGGGGIEGAEVRIQTYPDLVKKGRGILAQTRDDKAAVSEALDREIFPKMKL